MRHTKNHFLERKRVLSSLSEQEVKDALLKNGYYPSEILPPCFNTNTIKWESLQKTETCATADILAPKSAITNQRFSIPHPYYFRLLSEEIFKSWGDIVEHMFKDEDRRKIFSFGCSIPVNRSTRSSEGRNEYISMVEDCLVADLCGYGAVVHADIKNFYPSVYSHSIPWAIHGKEKRKNDRHYTGYFGSKIDSASRQSNDARTNGLPIGPLTSDIIGEIILSQVDLEVSNEASNCGINMIGGRFRDDYRILTKNRHDGERIVKFLQECLSEYNLELNQEKTHIEDPIKGLYRPWAIKYNRLNVRKSDKFSLSEFESLYFSVLEIQRDYPSKGTTISFVKDLFLKDKSSNKTIGIRVVLNNRIEIDKFINLVWNMANSWPKTFIHSLALLEALYTSNVSSKDSILSLIKGQLTEAGLHEHKKCWIIHFLKNAKEPFEEPKFPGRFLSAMLSGKAHLFEEDPSLAVDILFDPVPIGDSTDDDTY